MLFETEIQRVVLTMCPKKLFTRSIALSCDVAKRFYTETKVSYDFLTFYLAENPIVSVSSMIFKAGIQSMLYFSGKKI